MMTIQGQPFLRALTVAALSSAWTLLGVFACNSDDASPPGNDATGGNSSGGSPSVATGGSSTGGVPSGGASGGTSSGGDGGEGGQVESDPGSWSGCEEFVLPPDCTIPEGAVLPGELRCTGLYSDWETRALRCGVRPFTPAYQLWTDGAKKQRYVWLPPGSTVDVSEPDAFRYPVGTRFWKEFYVGEEGNQKLGETRYLLRSQAGWLYTAYVWSEDGETATQMNDGVTDLFGTGHSVPTREQCKTCHEGRTDFILGWDAILLGEGAVDLTLQDLSDEGWLTGLDESLLTLTVPGDAVEQAALGYLHTNCGVSCHNTTLYAPANSSNLYLRLDAGELESPHTTAAVVSGINRAPGAHANYGDLPQPGLVYYDFRPLDPERSLSLARMKYRGSETAMPPVGTHVVDPHGVEVVEAWIESMTEERGYPAPLP